MVYLVTPRRTFRILGHQAILDADGTKLGMLLSYASDTRDAAVIDAVARELIDAVGSEWRLGGETVVLVQALIGFDPRKASKDTLAAYTSFELTGGSWASLPDSRVSLPIGSGSVPPTVMDDPDFPLDSAGLSEAAATAARWVSAADAGAALRLINEMTTTAASNARQDPEWHRLVSARAALTARGQRRELYRLLSWATEPSPRSSFISVAYDADFVSTGSVIEKVTLLKEEGRWRVSSYRILSSEVNGRPSNGTP
jgi:hypothetical protein